MNKILLIGDSHGGAIRKGLQIAQDKGLIDNKIDYCCGTVPSFLSCLDYQGQGRLLVHPTVHRAPHGDIKLPICIDEYEKILLVTGKNPFRILRDLADWQFSNHFTPVSNSLIDQFFVSKIGFLPNFPNFTLCEKLIASVPSKCIYVGRPLSARIRLLSSDNNRDEMISLVMNLKKRIDNIFLNRAYSIVFPPLDLLDGLTTKSEFLLGGLNTRGEIHHRKNDKTHMNESYGFAIIQEALLRAFI